MIRTPGSENMSDEPEAPASATVDAGMMSSLGSSGTNRSGCAVVYVQPVSMIAGTCTVLVGVTIGSMTSARVRAGCGPIVKIGNAFVLALLPRAGRRLL